MQDEPEVSERITPRLLLKAYAAGIFPMADAVDDEDLFWVDPEWRGILPLDEFHIPRSLKKAFRKSTHSASLNQDFDAVLRGCAGEQPETCGMDRSSTWISHRIRKLYGELQQMGHCHSLEIWESSELIGGLYGVSLGAAFFGESMFSLRPNASKFALIELVYRLKVCGFRLLDTQFQTDHLKQFGVREVAREEYHLLLADALMHTADLEAYEGGATSESILQSFSQTS